MKKTLFFIIACCVFSLNSYSQVQSGKRAAYLNSVFIKDIAGIDLDVMATVSDVWVESLPAKDSIINGVKYNQHMNFQAPGYQPTLVNLHQILLGYKDKPVNNLRMLLINNKLCPEDIYSYMFDKDYILRVEVINSDEIEDLKNHSCKFSIVRIFTKTKENLEKEKEPKRIR